MSMHMVVGIANDGGQLRDQIPLFLEDLLLGFLLQFGIFRKEQLNSLHGLGDDVPSVVES
jgi:hypothetical protein